MFVQMDGTLCLFPQRDVKSLTAPPASEESCLGCLRKNKCTNKRGNRQIPASLAKTRPALAKHFGKSGIRPDSRMWTQWGDLGDVNSRMIYYPHVYFPGLSCINIISSFHVMFSSTAECTVVPILYTNGTQKKFIIHFLMMISSNNNTGRDGKLIFSNHIV